MSRNGGKAGMQYMKKSFSVPMGGTSEDFKPNIMSEDDRIRIAGEENERQNELDRQPKIISKCRHVIPFGDRILVRRRKIGEKLGSGLLVASDETKDRDTEIADVVFIPDHTFADKSLLDKSEAIVNALIQSAESGSSDALVALLRYNDYLKIKALKPGDVVMISKYVGTTFFTSDNADSLTMLNSQDIIGVIYEEA